MSRLSIDTELTFEECVKYIEKFITPILKENSNNLKWNSEQEEWEN